MQSDVKENDLRIINVSNAIINSINTLLFFLNGDLNTSRNVV